MGRQGGYGVALCNSQRCFAGAQLEAELTQQLAQKSFSEQAKAILKQLTGGQRPGIQDLARELHLSTRTLQRRLTEQGITFQRLLEEEARRELARHYLLHSSRELNETAYLLGYEDANSFFRAFHHWEASPAQWRVLQRKSRPTTHAQVGAM